MVDSLLPSLKLCVGVIAILIQLISSSDMGAMQPKSKLSPEMQIQRFHAQHRKLPLAEFFATVALRKRTPGDLKPFEIVQLKIQKIQFLYPMYFSSTVANFKKKDK